MLVDERDWNRLLAKTSLPASLLAKKNRLLAKTSLLAKTRLANWDDRLAEDGHDGGEDVLVDERDRDPPGRYPHPDLHTRRQQLPQSKVAAVQSYRSQKLQSSQLD